MRQQDVNRVQSRVGTDANTVAPRDGGRGGGGGGGGGGLSARSVAAQVFTVNEGSR